MSDLTVIEDSLFSLETGEPMFVFKGGNLSNADLIRAVEAAYGDPIAGMWLDVSEGKWGWTNRFKHCSNHCGWGCDREGEWHRHYDRGYGTDVNTAVTLCRRKPVASKDVVLVAASSAVPSLKEATE